MAFMHTINIKGLTPKSVVKLMRKIAWLRQVLDWHDEVGDLRELSDALRQDVLEDRIYVFTRDGHVVDLPVRLDTA